MVEAEQRESETKPKKRQLKERLRVIAELQPPWKKDFDDPKLEWRRLSAEILGTFFLVLAAVGGGIVSVLSKGVVSLPQQLLHPV
ncbi:MAG TPA: hypothetical protein VMT42_02710 [candidate division Zixibacteria bacterium]|nr:hypothetical protein [candidate division Zixibacteria bacterium]